MENTSVGNMIEDSKVLVCFFEKSGMNNELSKTLKQEVLRFNSIYTMLASLDDVYDEIIALDARPVRCRKEVPVFF